MVKRLEVTSTGGGSESGWVTGTTELVVVKNSWVASSHGGNPVSASGVLCMGTSGFAVPKSLWVISSGGNARTMADMSKFSMGDGRVEL